MQTSILKKLMGLTAVCTLLVSMARAEDNADWQGGSSVFWSGANWMTADGFSAEPPGTTNPPTPLMVESAVFSGSFGDYVNRNAVTLDTTRYLLNLKFGGASVTNGFTISATDNATLNLIAGGAITTASGFAGDLVINPNINIVDLGNGASQYSFNNNVAATGNIIINGNITNATSGTMSLLLNGGNNNKWNKINGNISDGVNGATSVSLSTGNLWSLNGDNSAMSGGVNSNANGTTLGIGSATALGTGTLTLARTTVYNTSGGDLTLTTNNDIFVGGWFTYQGDNKLDMGAGTVTMQGDSFTINAGELVIGGQIIDATTTHILKKGGNGTLTLAGDNASLAADITVSGGKLNLNSATAIGTGALTLASGFSGTLGNSSGAPVTLATNNNINIGNGQLAYSGGVLNLGSGTIFTTKLNADVTVSVNDGTLTVGHLNSTYNFTTTGSGALVFTGDVVGAAGKTFNMKSFGGLVAFLGDVAMPISITSGVLGVKGDYSPTTSQIQFVTGGADPKAGGFAAYGGDATVTLNGGDEVQFGSTNLPSLLVLSSIYSAHTVTLANDLNVRRFEYTVQVDNGAAAIDAVFAGDLRDAQDFGNNFIKTGAGTLLITGNITYQGRPTVVGAGTLLINGTHTVTGSGSGAYTVNAGATLGGHGTINLNGTDITIENGGKLSVSGDGALDDIGALTLNLNGGKLNLSDGVGVLGFTLGADGVSDQIILGANTTLLGDLTLDNFDFIFGSEVAQGNTYSLITGDMNFMTFSEISGNIGNYEIELALNAGHTALTLAVINIPEPSTWLLLGVGVALLAVSRRRKRAL
ncbi:MAG: autotransporter-associated beta strand repeat-containing protein [Verrucomicrobiales bacterium]|jgi:autotransporter-associated beta strand protein|nr:autotransporter-associated beta strand repeat-containing protein [Verrucomicrobiales bacterium]